MMQIAEQQAIRTSTAAVVLDWAASRQPPFAGDNADEFRDAITAAYLVADEGRLNLQRWVDAARRSGLSWTEIGETLGMSKQAAQQRFKRGDIDEPAIAEDGAKIVRFGATAFNEMAIMRHEGRAGNELIQIGALQLMFRSTADTWEYRRTIGLTATLARMEQAGWTYVASWLPFHYFKRRVPSA